MANPLPALCLSDFSTAANPKTTMHILTITDDDSKTEIVRIVLTKRTDPSKTAQAVLKAIDGLPQIRNPRSDKGKSKTPKAAPAATPSLPGV